MSSVEEAAVADMTAMLQCDARTARYYLSLANGAQQAAVGLYFENGAAPPPESFENDRSPQPKYEVPTTAPGGSPLPEVASAEQREALEAFASSLSVQGGAGDARPVFKDECLYGFDTPESEGGLFLNLGTLYSVGSEFLDMDVAKTGTKYYLHQKHVKVPKAEQEQEEEKAGKGETEGTGNKGGAKEATTVNEHLQKVLNEGDKFDTQKTTTIYDVAAKSFIPYPFAGISTHLYNVCETLLAATDKGTEQAVTMMEEEKVESKYAKDLKQEPGVTVNPDPKSWVCKEDGMTENLWLNLSDGHIGSGRQYYDGSGGKNGALNHYHALLKEGKNYPLVVKLGTITKDGADVYSYASDENRAVIDPYLATHLANIGINIMKLEKTEKTAAELEYERNLSHNWSATYDKDGECLPVEAGPGLVGLENLGNSCYMNSVLQALFTVSEVREDFSGESAKRIFSTCTTEAPHLEFDVNLAKVGHALFRPDAKAAVRPQAFKNFIGRRHPLFSTGQQQDAGEFLAHLFQVATRAHAKALTRPDSKKNKPFRNFVDLFSFHIERRTQCGQSGKVRYTIEPEQTIGMSVPMDNAKVKPEAEGENDDQSGGAAKKIKLDENKVDNIEDAPLAPPPAGEDQPDDVSVAESAAAPAPAPTPTSAKKVTYIVDFVDCLAAMKSPEVTADWMSPVTGRKGTCTRQWGFKTLPRFLLWKVNRFYVDEKWTPQKRDVEVEMPQELDIANLMSTGLQPGEEEFSDTAATIGDAGAQQKVAFVPDEASIEAITNMGFSRNAGIRACIATSNAGAEACANWVMMHMEDADLNDPVPDANGSANEAGPPEQLIEFLVGMGLPRHHSIKALKECNNDTERAVEWAFAHPVEPEESEKTSASAESASVGEKPADSEGGAVAAGSAGEPGAAVSTKYQLRAVITHLGRNSSSGHYVCHLRSEVRAFAWLPTARQFFLCLCFLCN
eukprot:INCI14764.6.p1 GENE.INCI14764.6~~INCI14764.6.p1  ORF type:complete len:961 (-),score=193.48 INCI14764.6:128-3010(-)